MSSTRRIAGLIGVTIGSGVYGALSGAIMGSIGASVLGYSVREAAAVGAVGSSILNGSVGLAAGLFLGSNNQPPAVPASVLEISKSKSIGLIGLGLGMNAASGALGYEVLKSVVALPLAESALAMVAGTGVVVGSIVALAVVAGCCLCASMAISRIASSDADLEMDNAFRMI